MKQMMQHELVKEKKNKEIEDKIRKMLSISSN
jgi:hypothetical protein